MEIKEYFDKIPLSTKIVGAILIGVIAIFIFYVFLREDPNIAKQRALGVWWENHERQTKQEAENAHKEVQQKDQEMLQMLDKWEKEDLEKRKVKALEGIKDNLDRR